MSLAFPNDLDAWQDWQRRHHLVRRIKHRLRPVATIPPTVFAAGPEPRILLVTESASASNRAAFLAPVAHIPREEVAILAPDSMHDHLPGSEWAPRELETIASGLRVTLAPGHYGLGGIAYELSRSRSFSFLIAQHGLMTPLAPPLPEGAHLLAWSEADAAFWWSGRGGQTTVVGSQLLWDAGSQQAEPVAPDAPPVYLGQLHGAELPRRDLARAARDFCRRHDATYRPHPSEVDRLSRWQHARWERAGIRFDRSGTPLHETTAPVVGVFSTGVVEAAARAIPAWVDYPDPPPWLRDFWARYDLRPYGGEPTPPPPRPAVEPAVAVAEILRSHL